MGDLPTEHKTWNLPLNDKYYDLDDDAKTFFKKETGIQDISTSGKSLTHPDTS